MTQAEILNVFGRDSAWAHYRWRVADLPGGQSITSGTLQLRIESMTGLVKSIPVEFLLADRCSPRTYQGQR